MKYNKKLAPTKSTFSDLAFHFVFAIILPYLVIRQIRENTEIWANIIYFFLWIFLTYSALYFIARLINVRIDRPLKFAFYTIKRKVFKYLLKRNLFKYSFNDNQRNIIAVAIPLIFYVIVYALAYNAGEKWGESRKISAFNFVTTWQYWVIGVLIVSVFEIKLFESKNKKP
jgi:hypothetical protein